MAHGGITNLSADDKVSEMLDACLTGPSPLALRSLWWHKTWDQCDHLPAWDIPFWVGTDIDVQNWGTPDEFVNFLGWNIVCCYLWVKRITKGIEAEESDIMSLLTSAQEFQIPYLLDPTSPHIIRTRKRLEEFTFDFLDGVSAWRELGSEPVDYPDNGLLETLTLVRANYNAAQDHWYEMTRPSRLRRDRTAIKRAHRLCYMIKSRHLMTSARTLSRMVI